MKIFYQDNLLTIKHGEKSVFIVGTKMSETCTQFDPREFQRAIEEMEKGPFGLSYYVPKDKKEFFKGGLVEYEGVLYWIAEDNIESAIAARFELLIFDDVILRHLQNDQVYDMWIEIINSTQK